MEDRAARPSWRRSKAIWARELPVAASSGAITEADFLSPYVEAISVFADLKRIAAARQKYAIDCMYGAGRGVLAGIFAGMGIDHVEIRAELNPLFPGIQPEPIPPHIRALEVAVLEHHCQAGFATDGDADRIGAVDEEGRFVDANKIYCLLLEWLLKRKQWPGDVARAFNTTKMLDRIAARYGRKVYEHGIGFKHVCELMLEKDILIGGEESGSIGIGRHLPERDGLLNALLLANIMAEEGRTLGSLVTALQEEYGEHHYGRLDLHIPEATKQAAIRRAAAGVSEFAGMRGFAPGNTRRNEVLSRQSARPVNRRRRGELAAAACLRHRAVVAHIRRERLSRIAACTA